MAIDHRAIKLKSRAHVCMPDGMEIHQYEVLFEGKRLGFFETNGDTYYIAVPGSTFEPFEFQRVRNDARGRELVSALLTLAEKSGD